MTTNNVQDDKVLLSVEEGAYQTTLDALIWANNRPESAGPLDADEVESLRSMDVGATVFVGPDAVDFTRILA